MKTKHCAGCRDDFYNGVGAKECWMLKIAHLVTRYEIRTWTRPTQPGAFAKVCVFNCYHRDGSHYYDKLPSFVKKEDVT